MIDQSQILQFLQGQGGQVQLPGNVQSLLSGLGAGQIDPTMLAMMQQQGAVPGMPRPMSGVPAVNPMSSRLRQRMGG